MTTTNLNGYTAVRDPATARIGKFDLTEAVGFSRATISFVSADNQRSFLALANGGGPTDVQLGDLVDIQINQTSILAPGGGISPDYELYIADIRYTDGGEKSLIELGVYETAGNQSWIFTLGGEEPSFGLGWVGAVREYDDALREVRVPGGAFAPGTSIFVDTIPEVRTTENDFYAGTVLDDVVNLGVGNDSLRGDDGDDELFGDIGRDTLLGENGDDTLRGGDDQDRLLGGSGADVLYGDDKQDTLRGGDGADLLDGGTGTDFLDGGDGSDTLIGGEGDDVLTGGIGSIDALDLNNPIANFGPGGGAGGWNSQNGTPRLLGDIDGDGAADILGFGGPRTFAALNDGSGGFAGLVGAVDNFAQAQGWRTQDGQTRLLGDVDGDGDDDIIGFGFNAGFTTLSNGDGTFSGFTRAVGNFANAQGWKSDNETPRVMADIDGDGIDDIVGFGARQTFSALGRGDGTFGPATGAIANFSKAQGWASNDTFLRQAADVNGDGMADIVGFGINGTFTALSNGDGTFGNFRAAIANFGKKQGWGDNDATPRAVGDVDGDGIADIVGFGGPRTFAALGQGDGTFGEFQALSDDFSRDRGWTSFDRLPRQVADLDGDGLEDLVGFSTRGVLTRLIGPEVDTFVFASGDGTDTVTSFDPTDILDLSGAGLSPAQALAAAVQAGDDIEIAYGRNTVVIENYLLGDLTLDNFA